MVFGGFFDKIKKGLARTRDLFSGIASLFRLRGRVDREFLQKLEERLYLADVGSVATTEIVEQVRQAFLDKEITGDVEVFVKQKLKDLVGEGKGLRRGHRGHGRATAHAIAPDARAGEDPPRRQQGTGRRAA